MICPLANPSLAEGRRSRGLAHCHRSSRSLARRVVAWVPRDQCTGSDAIAQARPGGCATRTPRQREHTAYHRVGRRRRRSGRPGAGPECDGHHGLVEDGWVQRRGRPAAGAASRRERTHDVASEAGPILNGIPSRLPDIDPDETQEWIDSLDAVLDEKGRTRARYIMLKAHRARAPAAGRRPVPDGDRLHQHDPARARAVVPRRRGRRARDAPLHPLERRDHGAPRAAARHRRRRAHLDVRVRRDALRGGHEPLLPRQGPPRRRRPDLLPGPRLPRHVRPQAPRGPPDRGAGSTASARRRATASTARSRPSRPTRTRGCSRTTGSSRRCRWASAR